MCSIGPFKEVGALASTPPTGRARAAGIGDANEIARSGPGIPWRDHAFARCAGPSDGAPGLHPGPWRALPPCARLIFHECQFHSQDGTTERNRKVAQTRAPQKDPGTARCRGPFTRLEHRTR